MKPDWGCDSGLFLHSSEVGAAYQVMLDYLPGGNMGGVYGEALQGISAESSHLERDVARSAAGFRVEEDEAWAEGLEARTVEFGARPHHRQSSSYQYVD